MTNASKSSESDEVAGYPVGWSLCVFAGVALSILFAPIIHIFKFEQLHFMKAADLLTCGIFVVDSYMVRKLVVDSDDRKSLLPNRWIEIFSALPLFNVEAMFGFSSGYCALLLLNHGLRLGAVVRAFSFHASHDPTNKRVKLTVLVVTALGVIHLVACGFMYLWPDQPDDFVTRYNIALYWAITTLATVGYGDIVPKDNLSRVFTMHIMLIGAASYGFMISQISTFLLALDIRKEEEKNQLETLASIFKHYAIPKSLQRQTMSFFRHRLQKASIDSEQKILGALPKVLSNEIQVFMNIKPLSHVSLFKNCSHACLAEAAHCLVEVDLAPGESIFHQGDVGHEMYIIGWGKVRVHSGSKTIAELKHGDAFGEMALITDDRRGASITALTYCDLFKLERSKFTELTARHQDLMRNVNELSNARKREAA